MPKRFFQLADDVYFPNRWHLETPKDSHGHEVHDSKFWSGAPVHLADRLTIAVELAGQTLDYTEAGLNVPVIHDRLAAVFARHAPEDVQLIPVTVEGQADPHFILVAIRLIPCIDDKASRFVRPKLPSGAPHPERRYSIMYELRIDKSRVGRAQVFRPEGWENSLIVSEDIKSALERMGATGPKFTEV